MKNVCKMAKDWLTPRNMVIKKAMDKWYDHAILREGKKNVVYLDTLGKPTGGIGHLIRAGDGYFVGDKIPDDVIYKWFEQDSKKALDAAIEQADKTGRFNSDWLMALISVNFQLGTRWIYKFKNSWPALVNGKHEKAIKGFKSSLWAKQTPVRVDDFIKAIRKAYG